VLHKSLWREALKYFAILGLVNCVGAILQVVADTTCTTAAQAGTTHEDKLERLAMCRAAFVPYILIVRLAVFVCAVYWAMCVGGPRRKQLRQELGIPPTDTNGQCCHMLHDNSERCNDDCCLHYWCLPCALCQEARTVYHMQREQQSAAASMPAGYMMLQAPLVVDDAGMTRTSGAAAAGAKPVVGLPV
jgi:hypothetical protein